MNDFETWWASFWKRTGQPEVFDLAIKEVAEKAWNEAHTVGYGVGYNEGYDNARDDLL